MGQQKCYFNNCVNYFIQIIIQVYVYMYVLTYCECERLILPRNSSTATALVQVVHVLSNAI